MEDAQATDGGLDGTDEFDDSVMAWEITAKGKSARDIGALHEAWAAAHVARGAVNKAQVSWWHPSRRRLSFPSSAPLKESTLCMSFLCHRLFSRENQTIARVATTGLNVGATGYYSIL